MVQLFLLALQDAGGSTGSGLSSKSVHLDASGMLRLLQWLLTHVRLELHSYLASIQQQEC